ncbi:Hypothetical predicted protein [Mytilus galloprovincialis]|uniref:Reverse transcriptase domain-containing protein n=1 Tax=Mytilus galloprovincialis TaxID=29158 RepID=A0A8B6FXG0_MYTGA|nr:Hypothetical predicted protein [Mytilus galloprovincialis]
MLGSLEDQTIVRALLYIVVVKRKDDTHRFCTDFRQINKITKSLSYPLPLIDDILAQLGNAEYIPSCDLKSGFWQILMNEKKREKTAFSYHRGLFEYNVMPFGLQNSPAVFFQLMEIVLENLPFAIAYIDDVLTYYETLEDHLSDIEQVFDRLRKHKLKFNLKKNVNYLGFQITGNDIKPKTDKVETIRSFPPPFSVKEVRSFTGMLSYYRRCIPNVSKISVPLVDLTKKYAKFRWSDECQTAFELKRKSINYSFARISGLIEAVYLIYRRIGRIDRRLFNPTME